MSTEPTKHAFIGWDLGGAHLKVAYLCRDTGLRHVAQYPCKLWLGLEHLHQALDQALLDIGKLDNAVHAVTMTAELVDLFPDRQTGVQTLVNVLTERFPNQTVRIFAGHYGFITPTQAMLNTDSVASANWYATASFLAKTVEHGLLIDVGSTTTDLILLRNRQVLNRGYSDFERMHNNELIYTGVVRTSLMSLVDKVPFCGTWHPLMAEHFATTADVYRLLGQLNDKTDMMPTADGGGKTLENSARRLARMLGLDLYANAARYVDVKSAFVHRAPSIPSVPTNPPDIPMHDWRTLANYICKQQLRQIAEAVDIQLSRGVLNAKSPFIGAGAGRFLVRKIAQWYEHPYLDFANQIQTLPELQEIASICAPAVACAYLASVS